MRNKTNETILLYIMCINFKYFYKFVQCHRFLVGCILLYALSIQKLILLFNVISIICLYFHGCFIRQTQRFINRTNKNFQSKSPSNQYWHLFNYLYGQ